MTSTSSRWPPLLAASACASCHLLDLAQHGDLVVDPRGVEVGQLAALGVAARVVPQQIVDGAQARTRAPLGVSGLSGAPRVGSEHLASGSSRSRAPPVSTVPRRRESPRHGLSGPPGTSLGRAHSTPISSGWPPPCPPSSASTSTPAVGSASRSCTPAAGASPPGPGDDGDQLAARRRAAAPRPARRHLREVRPEERARHRRSPPGRRRACTRPAPSWPRGRPLEGGVCGWRRRPRSWRSRRRRRGAARRGRRARRGTASRRGSGPPTTGGPPPWRHRGPRPRRPRATRCRWAGARPRARPAVAGSHRASGGLARAPRRTTTAPASLESEASPWPRGPATTPRPRAAWRPTGRDQGRDADHGGTARRAGPRRSPAPASARCTWTAHGPSPPIITSGSPSALEHAAQRGGRASSASSRDMTSKPG